MQRVHIEILFSCIRYTFDESMQMHTLCECLFQKKLTYFGRNIDRTTSSYSGYSESYLHENCLHTAGLGIVRGKIRDK